MTDSRVLSVYDGRALIGRIKIAKQGEAHAFNQRGKLIALFPNLKSALNSFDQRSPVDGDRTNGAVSSSHHEA